MITTVKYIHLRDSCSAFQKNNKIHRHEPQQHRYESDKMSKFQTFVKDIESWFLSDVRETEQSLAHVEASLKLPVPCDIKWLLMEYGYGEAIGIENKGETIEKTIQAREFVELPDQYLVLYDHHDGGVILLVTLADDHSGDQRIIDSAWQSIPEYMEQEIIYPSFFSFVKSLIEVRQQ